VENNRSFGFLRTIALIVLLFGGLSSVYFVFNAGRNNNSVLLRALFVIWVLSPYIGILIANSISKRWSFHTRKTIYRLMLIITVGSLIVYSGIFKIPGTKNAFIFLIVPFLSWLFLIIPILIGRTKNDDTSLNSNINL